MSEIRVENIIGETGTDAVKFTKGINVTGVTTATSFSGSGASLTSLPAANLTGTLPAISGANLTGLSAGVTAIDAWAISAAYTASSGANIISSNWYRFATASNTHFPQLGGAMTQSSGVFTFPSTGFWVLDFTLGGYNVSDNSGTYFGGQIFFSDDSGSSYDRIATAYTNMMGNQDHGEVFIKSYVDVTNASTCRVKFNTNIAASKTIFGDSDEMRTGVVFTRIGDT